LSLAASGSGSFAVGFGFLVFGVFSASNNYFIFALFIDWDTGKQTKT
jgi:hypothetical protein